MYCKISDSIIELVVSRLLKLRGDFAILTLTSKNEISFKLNLDKFSNSFKQEGVTPKVFCDKYAPQLYDFLEEVRRNEVNTVIRIGLETKVSGEFCRLLGGIKIIGGESYRLLPSLQTNSIALNGRFTSYNFFT